MNNEPMYNTFVKDRSSNNSQPDTSSAQRQPRSVSEEDIPDFDFVADDVIEEPEPAFSSPEPMGVESSLDSLSETMGHEGERPRSVLDELEEAYAKPDFSQNFYTDPFVFDEGRISLPSPEIFNSYPPEVQRKIMEWTDRDIRARRDDESRRQDAILRANIARDRNKNAVPVIVTVLLIICALVTGIYTKSAIFVISFLAVAVVVIVAFAAAKIQQAKGRSGRPPYSGR